MERVGQRKRQEQLARRMTTGITFIDSKMASTSQDSIGDEGARRKITIDLSSSKPSATFRFNKVEKKLSPNEPEPFCLKKDGLSVVRECDGTNDHQIADDSDSIMKESKAKKAKTNYRLALVCKCICQHRN